MSTEPTIQSQPLADATHALVSGYLETVNNKEITNLHELVLEQFEPALLKAVMENSKFNQSQAATTLGVSRGTCRALLIKYFDEQYCGRREERTGE